MEIKKFKNFARLGYFSKGVVYILVGIVTTLAAFGLEGKKSGKEDIFQFILNAPFGKIILGILAFGLLCFASWRFVQVMDGGGKKALYKDILKRIKHIASGFIYSGLSFYGASLIFFGTVENIHSREFFVAKLFDHPRGEWLVIIIALGIILNAFSQLYKALSGRFIKNIKSDNIKGRSKTLFLRAGQIGYTSKGIVLSIIGYLLILAAIHSNPYEVQETVYLPGQKKALYEKMCP